MQYLVGIDTVEPHHVGDGHNACGDGTCFIKNNCVHLPRCFQDFGAFDQHAELGAASRTYKKCGGCGEPQCTGARNDGNGDGSGKCVSKSVACNDVPSECEKRCEDDQRHEDLGNAVNKPLDGSFAGLCVADQPGDARERGVLANPLCLDDQATRSVHGGPSHDTAWGNIHRQRLASQHGLING